MAMGFAPLSPSYGYWRGDPGEAEPPISAGFRSAIEKLGTDIETDFAVSEVAR